MLTSEFDYVLPAERIAQHPLSDRDGSRLMIVDRSSHLLDATEFRNLPPLLRPGDLLIFNDSRVIPARLRGFKEDTKAAVELLLMDEIQACEWWSMVRPGKRVRPGMTLRLRDRVGEPSSVSVSVLEKNSEGHIRLRFIGTGDVHATLKELGEVPLPPYLARSPVDPMTEDQIRYQTVYAQNDGSIAAPTAGLHFSPRVLAELETRGIETAFLTLHVGHGTFAPVKADRVQDHQMHEERFHIPAETASAYERARAEGRRVIAIGTTSVRVMETVFRSNKGHLSPGSGRTRIFIHPPQRIESIDGLLTNFHLPQSTLLMLVSAFAAPGRHPSGRDLILRAYAEAIRLNFRFFSYGDAMLLI